MKNYRYVSQGEFFVTTDPKTVLVTTGMTECIALALIDRDNPENRLLAHFDGQILYSLEKAIENVQTLKEAFLKTSHAKQIDVHILGGQRIRRNYTCLLPALENAGLAITHSLDINEFCKQYNQKHSSRFNHINPLTACCTLLCEASLSPHYMNYDANYFSPPLSEEHLAEGQGLLDKKAQKEYQEFSNINDYILSNDMEAAQNLRTSADKEWVSEYKSEHLSTPSTFRL